MSRLTDARYLASDASGPEDLDDAQALRQRAFRQAIEGADHDRFDATCRHILIRRRDNGTLVSCFRVMILRDSAEIERSYSAQFYDLAALRQMDGPMLELGRFCVAPGETDPDILRVAFAALGRIVEAEGVNLLFGCSSFWGTEAAPYDEAFALLSERHLAPRQWLPQVKAPSVIRFAQTLPARRPDLKAALKAMPPLLRSYLALGAWVSDHAVIDRDMNTLHVFTGVEVAAIPAGRARILRGMAV